MSVKHTWRDLLRWAFQPKAAGKLRRGRPRAWLRLEELESRLVPSHVLTVDTTNDTYPLNAGSGTGLDSRGQVSLRSALETADAIGSSPSNPFTINIPAGNYNLTLGALVVGDSGDTDVILNGTDLAASIVIEQTNTTEPVFNLNPALNANVQISMTNVEITGGSSQVFGGGGIVGGGVGNSLTLTNVIVTGNASHHGPGGGGVEFDGGSLTLTNCTFTNNTAFGGTGGAVDFQPAGLAGSLNVTGSTFSGNSATVAGLSGGQGGAIYINGSAGNTYSIGTSNFTNNQASVSGGALANANGTVAFNFNRVVGNSAASGSGLVNASAADASIDASNTWWGSNLDPSTVSGLIAGTVTSNPWLVLGASASPTSLPTGGTAQITTSFTQNSAGTVLSASNLSALFGLPVSFAATAGNIAPAVAAVQSTAQAAATYTAGAVPGPGTASATADNATVTVGLTINLAVLITTPFLANWTVNVSGYSQTIHATGGTGTVTFAATGSLPPGLTLSSAGVLSGTPTTPGSYSFTVTASDVVGSSASQTYTVVINPAVALTTATLANWTVGAAGYSQTVSTTGGTGSLSFSATGFVPPGLTLNSAGVLSGMPTVTGSYGFTVTAVDTLGASGSRNYTVVINPIPSLLTTSLANWTAGLAAYSQMISASGGTGSLLFTATGSLPPGLTLSGAGVISGTPTTAGNYDFTVTATDAVGAGSSKTYLVVINPAIAITTPALVNWTAGLAGFSLTISATGGTGSLVFSATGTPPGLTLSSVGVLSGTPTTAGTYSFTITATDTVGAAGSKDYTVGINPAVSFTTTTLANWTAGLANYSQTIGVTGGTGAVSFNATGSLPPGLTLSSTGVLSGTPTNAGSYGFAVTATDALGATGSQSFTVVINPAVSLTTTTLAAWTANFAGYSQTIRSTGGTGPLTFSAVGSLPAGVSLSSTGVLAGTPTTAGSYTFTVTGADTIGATGSQNLTVLINPAVAITTGTLANWTAGLGAYSQPISASGGTGSLVFAATGSLPPGLALSSTGVLSGTPTAAGSYSFSVTATDMVGASGNKNYTVVINSAVALTTTTLTNWTTGLAGYTQTIRASGGTGTLAFSTTGTLPVGLVLSSIGVLSGTPTTVGTYSFTAIATDSLGATGTHTYSVVINPAVSLTTSLLATWTAGLAGYSQTISASGGTGPLTFTAMGSLPAGLTLSSAGVLSGTPTSAGSATFTVMATDTVGATGSHSYTVVINPAVSLTTSTLTNWTVGQAAYSQRISATGGTGSLTFSATGPLPPGLILNSTGVLSGTPMTAGSYGFTVNAIDSLGATGSHNYTVAINPAVSLTTTTLANWTAGLAGYSQTISATGGTGALMFSSTGILPTGLTMSSGGVLAGAPAVPGSYTFTITATDTVGASGSQIYTVVINPAVSFTTSTLANWTAGLAGYSQTIGTTGGTGMLTFSATGIPPVGLTLNSAGVLSGTPTTPGSYTFTVTATDNLGAADSHGYTVSINPVVSLTTTTLANWTAGLAGYSQPIDATGGTGALNFSTTGTPPLGLTLSSAGLLSGTPTTAGSYSFSITAMDAVGASGSQSYTVVINAAVSITTTSLANWTAGLAGYSQTISATGGTGPLTITATGSLPSGLTLNSAGVLSGTPTTAGSYGFTVTATDSLGAASSHAYTVVINSAVSFTTTTLANWTAGLQGYNQTIGATGGTGPLTFGATGSLPMGLTLSSGGALSGTPTAVGSYTFTVKAIDTLGTTNTQTYTVLISSAVSLTTTGLATWTAGLTGYSQTISATGGTGPLSFSATGSLPPGLTLSSTGVLAGTPTTAGSYSFLLIATDTVGASGNRSYAVTIDPPVMIATTTLASWTVGLAGYSQTISASGGTGSLTFSATGPLPPGLTLSSAGLLAGTPTAAGSYGITVTATDVLGATDSHTYTVVINSALSFTTSTLATWTAGLAGYSQTISTTGGTGPLSFSATGTTPPGLTLSTAGVLSGTPVTAGSYTFTVTVADKLGSTNSQIYTVLINPVVSLTTSTLATWTAGLAGYSQTINATGGTGSLTFAATGSLPPGLALSSAGVLLGTPTTAGSYSFSVTATDMVGASGNKAYSVVINPAVSLTTTTLANWTMGLGAYSQTVSASGGTGALTFSATGSLPPGLILSSVGLLSGTPTAAGSYGFTVTATDGLGAADIHNYTVVINPAVSFTTSTLATWTASLAGYRQTVSTTGGTGPSSFSATGSLPPGLTLGSAGLLSGTPTTAGSYPFSVTAIDTIGSASTQTFTVLINPAVSLTTTGLATWTAGLADYSQAINATGGTGPLIFSATGSLPPGLTLSSAGLISGTPTTAGSYSFLVIATDTVGASGSRSYTVVLNPAVVITTTTLTSWTAALAGYSQTITATGGTGALTYSATGPLPPGLVLSSTGLLAGTPMVAGNYGFAVTAADSLSATGSHNYTLVINPAVSFATTTLADWTAGLAGYNQTISATGGTGPLVYSATGSLPTGLTLGSGGAVSGTPTTVGTYTFSVTAADAVGATNSQSYTVRINPTVSLTTTGLTTWTAGLAGYSQTIGATGGTGALTFRATGSLPPGLTLSSTGVLAGTPTSAGSYSFLVTATDAVGASGSRSYSAVINPTVEIATTTLAPWTAALTGYSQTVSATGGTGSLTFSAAGSLPPGLTLSSAGLLAGTPTAAGSYGFTVTATDSLGATGIHSYTVVINPLILITTTALATWTASLAGYSQTINATGGTGPLILSATGSLPTGLTLSSDGALSGTPTSAGSYTFNVTATDTVGATNSQSFTVLINPMVSLTTTSLASWTANLSGYSQTISATGGTGSLTFSATGSLPAGLTLNSAGVLLGTPTMAGSYNFSVTATDTVGANGTKSYTVLINPEVSLTTSTLSAWTAGLTGYSQTIGATGGTGALTFSATGSLPPGLALSSAGLLSGTPTAAGSYSFTVTAADSLGATGSHGYTVVINPVILITTTALATWTAGLAGYGQTISATGGTGPLTFVAAGSVPPGLTLSTAGVLSGTPTAAGSYGFTVTAFDGLGAAGSHGYTLVVNPAVSLTTTTLANWTAGLAGYSQTVSASGGTGPLTFSATGSLPSGLTLSTGGVLSGTPLVAGSYTFTVTATDMLGASAGQSYTVAINPVVTLTTTTLAGWTAGLAGYSQTISASGGTGPLTFVATGSLPPGLTLSTAGLLSGTPTAAGSYGFTVTAFDSLGAAGSHGYTLVVNPAVELTTSTLANWTVGLPGYSQTLSATGGTGSKTFAQVGTLPTGLTLSSAGLLSGTPSAVGSYTFTVTAFDALGAGGSRNYTVVINPTVSFMTTSLANWTAGLAGYSQTISASGGTGSLTFSATGSLPTGLTLGSAGVLSGTPTAAGAFAFTVTATDTIGATASSAFVVSINPSLSIAPTSLPQATATVVYNQTITVSGGTTPYQTLVVTGFSGGGTGLTSGSVQTNPAAGTVTITGTPTSAGTVTFTVNVTDTAGATLSQPYSLTVLPSPVAHLAVSAPTLAAANGYFDFTVTALNQNNQIVSGYTGTVHFTSSDGAATLPADSKLTGGQGTFTATLRTLGNQTITATDTVTTTLTGISGIIDVICPSIVLASPSFTGQPGTMVDGHTIGFDAFPTIQQSLNVVCPGGTVYVNAATYNENLVINKAVTLQGSGSASAFLTGSGSGTGLTITGTSVSIGGLTVEDFATGLTAGSATQTLVLSDLKLTSNTAGGTITGVHEVVFTGNSADETLMASGTQFGRVGDNLLTYGGIGLLALDGNLGSNTLDLSSVLGSVGVTLTGPGSLEGFAGTVSTPSLIFTNFSKIVGNGGPGSALTGLNAPASWNVNGAALSQYTSGGQTLAFSSFPVLNGGSGSDTFTINSTGASGLTANGQGGGDTFQVAFGALAGPVALLDGGGSGVNTATLTAPSANNSLTVTASAVTWNNSQTVTYEGLEGLTVNAGAGTDAIAVQGTAGGTSTTINGGGPDTFVVTSPAGLLNTFPGPLFLNGGAGNNYLYVSEANRTTGDTVYVTDSALISGTGSFAPISYASASGTFTRGVILVTGSGNNYIRVYSTAVDDAYGLYTGNGNDTIAITSATSTLNTMAGSIAVMAGSGSNTLFVSESGSSVADTLSLSATGVQSTATGFSLSYEALGGNFGGGVYLVTGSAANTVRIYSTSAGSNNGIELGNGNNTVVVSSPTQTLDTMAGPIGIQGGTGDNLLYLSEAGSTVADSLYVSGVSVQSKITGLFVSYAASPGGTFGRGVDVVGGSGNNQFYVVGQLAGSPIGIYGGAGNDLIDVYVTAITFYNLWLDGGGGDNVLRVFELTGSGMTNAVTGPESGVLEITYPGGLPSTIRFNNLNY